MDFFSRFFLKILSGIKQIGPRSDPWLCSAWQAGPEVIKLFSCSTLLSMNCSLKLKYRQMKKFLALSLSDVVFIMLIDV